MPIDVEYIEDTMNTRFELLLEEINFGRLEFLDSFYTRMHELTEQGLDEEEIIKILYNEIVENKKLINLENKEATYLLDFFKSTSQYTVWSSLDENTLYEWVWTPGAAHCEGCRERNGQIKTFDEWDALGLPGSGSTDCQDNCLCDLEEVKEANEN